MTSGVRQKGGETCLSRDAPVADVVEPAEPSLLVLLRRDLELAVAHRVRGALRHVRAIHPPLRLEHRLDDVLCARAEAESHLVVRVAAEVLELLERLDHLLPCLEANEPGELAAVVRHRPFAREDCDLGQPVPPSGGEIVRVMRGRHLDGAGTEAHVDESRVGDHLDLPVDEGVHEILAVELRIPRVFGVDCDGNVSEHGLRARGGDDDLFLICTAIELVGKRPDDAKGVRAVLGVAGNAQARTLLEVNVVNLDVRDARSELAAPGGGVGWGRVG